MQKCSQCGKELPDGPASRVCGEVYCQECVRGKKADLDAHVVFRCDLCRGPAVAWTIRDLVERGLPVCPGCDTEMVLDSPRSKQYEPGAIRSILEDRLADLLTHRTIDDEQFVELVLADIRQDLGLDIDVL